MTASTALTTKRIADAICPGDKAEFTMWDGGKTAAPGLGLRVTSNGAKAFIFQFRIDGKAARLRIGDPTAWTLGDARIEARRLRALVDSGMDPRDEKREKSAKRERLRKQEKDEALTLRELWSTYVAEHESGWSASHLRDHHAVIREPGLPVPRIKAQKTIAGPLWSLANERVVDIPNKIESWLKQETQSRPTLTRKAFVLLKTCLNWHGLDLVGALDGKVRRNIKRALPKPKVKNDVLESSQLAVWWTEVGKLGFISSTFLRCLLLLGCRVNELASLRWEDVDLTWNTIILKNKDATGLEPTRTIPLTPYVRQLLLDLKDRGKVVALRRAGGKAPSSEETGNDALVFKAMRGHGGPANIGKDHAKATKAAGLPHITQHGLRRSFITLSEEAGIPSGAAAQICGHKPSALVEKSYKRRSMDQLRGYHEQVERFITDAAVISPTPKSDNKQTNNQINRVHIV